MTESMIGNICPNKKYLYPYDRLDKGLIKRYRIVGGYCKRCPLRTKCLPENHQTRARFVYRNPYQDEIDKVKRRQETTYFEDKLKQRQWKMEGLFGEAKENHSFVVPDIVGFKRYKFSSI